MLAWEMGRPSQSLETEEEIERYATTLCWRLTAQWPRLEFQLTQVRAWMLSAMDELVRHRGWRRGYYSDAGTFHAYFLKRAKAQYPQINPYYYDIPSALIRDVLPEAQPAAGPPGDWSVEESPFILAVPWAPMRDDDPSGQTLVLKAPSNAHRLEAIRALFSKAEMRVLHLTRNAAAAINGLIDGWHHHGFFSYRLGELRVRGYSDVFRAWGQSWWKFDLPPGWQSLRERSLGNVCAEQWCRAHRAIMSYVERRSPEYLQIKFEDVLRDAVRRRMAFQEIGNWLGVPMVAEAVRTVPPPTMATKAPAARRWLARAETLAPVLSHPEILEMMSRLGYQLDRRKWI